MVLNDNQKPNFLIIKHINPRMSSKLLQHVVGKYGSANFPQINRLYEYSTSF